MLGFANWRSTDAPAALMNSAISVLGVACIALGGAFLQMRARARRLEREQYIRSYVFPQSLLDALIKQHGHLVEKDCFLVARALRQFFLVRARVTNRLLGMPSKVVDDLWHEFILDTREYHRFCERAFGRFFHHLPAPLVARNTDIGGGMRVTWRMACIEENINPAKATRLPLLFAIDEKLAIVDGNRYNTRQYATSTATAGGCAGVACSGGDSNDGGSHGCGGGHCGGGCGGH